MLTSGSLGTVPDIPRPPRRPHPVAEGSRGVILAVMVLKERCT